MLTRRVHVGSTTCPDSESARTLPFAGRRAMSVAWLVSPVRLASARLAQAEFWTADMPAIERAVEEHPVLLSYDLATAACVAVQRAKGGPALVLATAPRNRSA